MGANSWLAAENSRNSSKSVRSGYRTVGKTSEVDESLFASAKATGAINKKSSPLAPLTKGNSKAPAAFKPTQHETVTLRRAELERMRAPPEVMTAEQVATLKHRAEEKKDAERATANMRKAMMLQMEEERKKSEAGTETDRLKRKADSQTLTRAEQLLQEERDEVKFMNQMTLYSKCVTIRDAQIEEKKNMLAEEEAEERELDLQMEIDRLRAIEAYEVREREREVERKRGAAILGEQLAEREAARVRVLEVREAERAHMQTELERMKRLEQQAVLEKAKRAEEMAEEVSRSNDAMLAKKEAAKRQEAEDDAHIADYIRQRDLREQAAAEEKARLSHEKEMETARLRAQQERANDRQAELDELRARRYQEAYEREWRTKERAERDRVADIYRDLAAAREAQQAAKVAAQAEMATIEASEFHRVLDEHRTIELKNIAQAEAAAEVRRRHKDELRAQIQANEERRAQEREAYLQEGAKTREALAREKDLVESIRQRKLKEMEAEGIPAKYRAELARKKIGNWK